MSSVVTSTAARAVERFILGFTAAALAASIKAATAALATAVSGALLALAAIAAVPLLSGTDAEGWIAGVAAIATIVALDRLLLALKKRFTLTRARFKESLRAGLQRALLALDAIVVEHLSLSIQRPAIDLSRALTAYAYQAYALLGAAKARRALMQHTLVQVFVARLALVRLG